MILDNVVTNGPALPVPGHLSFGQYVIDRLKQHSEEDAAALINGETGHEISYKEMLQATVNVAAGLKRLGVGRGDVVALYSENCDEFFAIALGVVCAGATLTTINVFYTEDEIIHVLSLSQPKVIFASEIGLRNQLTTLKAIPSIQTIIQINGSLVDNSVMEYRCVLVSTDPQEFEPEEVQGWSDVVFILYSSGTTGLPKGVMMTHLNELYSASQFEYEVQCDANSRNAKQLTVVPWYHSYGLKTTICSFIVKKQVVYLPGFNPSKYLETIHNYKITELVTVPPIVVFLAKSPLVEKYDLSSVTVVWCVAAPLTAETIELARKCMPNAGIFQGYGLTETTLTVTKDIIDKKAKPGSAGYPLRGIKMKIVDIETRAKLGSNKHGEICIKGPMLMKGYIDNEVATSAMFDEEGYMKTGDIGYYDQDGCLYVVDRLKELIKYNGFQVAPAAVESVVLQHSGVAECGVVGAPDEVVGERPVAFVVTKPGVSLTKEELLDFTATRLSKMSRLHDVIFVAEIPKSPTGKILRRLLQQKVIKRSKSKL